MKIIVSILLIVLLCANYAIADLVIDVDISFNGTIIPLPNLSDTGSSLLNIANGLVDCLISGQNLTLSELGNALTALNTSLTPEAFKLVSSLIEALLTPIGAVNQTLTELVGTAQSNAYEVNSNLLALLLQIQTLKVQILSSVINGLQDILDDAIAVNSSLVSSIEYRISRLKLAFQTTSQDAICTGLQLLKSLIDPQLIDSVLQTLGPLIGQFIILPFFYLQPVVLSLSTAGNLTLPETQNLVDQLANSVREMVRFVPRVINSGAYAMGDIESVKKQVSWIFATVLANIGNELVIPLVIPSLQTQLSMSAVGAEAAALRSLISTLKRLISCISAAYNILIVAYGGPFITNIFQLNEQFYETEWAAAAKTCANHDIFGTLECGQPTSECGVCNSGYVRSTADVNACVAN